MKQRRSYFKINDDELQIFRYETMPIKWLGLGGTLRSSYMKLDVKDTEGLDRLLNIMIETLIEDKKGLQITIGGNPYEDFYFGKKELEDLAIDTVIAKEYGLAYKELRDYKEEISSKVLDWEILYRLENRIVKLEKYKALLRERSGGLSNRIDMEFINAKSEVSKLIKKLKENKSKEQ